MKKAIVWILLSAVAGFLAVIAVNFATDGRRVRPRPPAGQGQEAMQSDGVAVETEGDADPDAESSEENETDNPAEEEDDDGDGDDEEPQTEEEMREAEEEKRVDAFDNFTDKWQEASEKAVTMADVNDFAKHFRQVPKARQDECVHRALNLIPDENVMLLAGILMDRSMDQEIVETVFNDILNRDEDVKKPILQQIFKDKTHPCWADTAWILDVTGELPQSKAKED